MKDFNTFSRTTKRPEIKYKGGGANLYAWYYNTQAYHQAGGSFWSKWNRAFQEEVLNAQSEDGSWPETGSTQREGNMHWTGTGTSEDAFVYRTSLCVLMLEVLSVSGDREIAGDRSRLGVG